MDRQMDGQADGQTMSGHDTTRLYTGVSVKQIWSGHNFTI